MGTVLVGRGRGHNPGTFSPLEPGGFHRVRGRRAAQHIAPAVAALPERGVVPEQSDTHAEHGEEKPGLLDSRGNVDPGAAGRYRGPAGELPPDLLDDLGLAGVGKGVAVS